jgi:hypothetical protein
VPGIWRLHKFQHAKPYRDEHSPHA